VSSTCLLSFVVAFRVIFPIILKSDTLSTVGINHGSTFMVTSNGWEGLGTNSPSK
jgi:hypothetical protein